MREGKDKKIKIETKNLEINVKKRRLTFTSLIFLKPLIISLYFEWWGGEEEGRERRGRGLRVWAKLMEASNNY